MRMSPNQNPTQGMGVMQDNFRSFRSALTALAVGGLLITGCSTKESRLGADIESDACKTYKVALDSTGDFFEEDMIKGAVVGAIGGALAGALIGGDWQGAAAGALAGAAVGAATGYWQYKQQQTQDQSVLYASVLSDLEAENAQIDKSQLALDQLIDCRRNEANKIRADLKAKRITKDVADLRMNELRGRYSADLELARLINTNIRERSTNFEFANEQVNPNSKGKVQQIAAREQQRLSANRPGRSRPAPAPSRPTTASSAQVQVLNATATNQAKRNHFEQTVEVASSDQGFLTV